ncbi:MAG: zinc ribbon domain-containing protein [Planctomycetota bacterium]|nr:zinc ribbon domain-containing protein [Planctomycetota bacterium]
MPIYEYVCKSCQHPFEVLVRRNAEPVACPDCGSQTLQKKWSVFSAQSGSQSPPAPAPGPG